MNPTRHSKRFAVSLSAMGAGCWAIGGPFTEGAVNQGWGEVDDAESGRAIHAAINAGITFFDTADVYGAGHSERVLGKALASHRKKVIIATKFGYTYDETTRQKTGSDASPAYIKSACDRSLQRLNTDYIDLYQLHISNYDPGRISEVVVPLEKLVDQGKIRFYGWSTRTADRAQAIAYGTHCLAIQHPLNVLQDDPDMLSVCEKNGLLNINRSPLGMGLLTGKYTEDHQFDGQDVRGVNGLSYLAFFTDGRPSPEWLQKLSAIRDILQSKGRTLAQGALAWIWGRSPNAIPIPGFKTAAQIEENAKAMQFGPLSPEQMVEIDLILGRDKEPDAPSAAPQ
jgi:aryl-alcohol dehydrogenase-like predicted oxidoreductase